MTTTPHTDPAAMPWLDVPTAKPKPLTSLTASAQRMVSKKMKSATFRKPHDKWQEDAWEMFDVVGEQRFLATTLAGRMGQAKFYVGTSEAADGGDTPDKTQDDRALGVLASLEGLDQLVHRLAINLFVAGDGYLVGVPRELMPDNPDSERYRDPSVVNPSVTEDGMALEDLEWRMLSVSEIDFRQEDEIGLHLGSSQDEVVTVRTDDVYLIRVWRSHPRRAWEADSPTRSSLPVLRELVGLTMHISAQVDSRLAGAGVLLVPQSAQRALREAAGLDDNDEEEGAQADPFEESLMDAMMTPIDDRSSAAAVVPLVTSVPDESIQHFRHISFASPLDDEARELRDEAIRRLALGQDAPPELLLGMDSMNHWGAWLVREDVVSTHLEPVLALICDALTVQFLRPVLEELGYSEEEAAEFVIWYDVSHMISRPNRAADAQQLHDRGVISDSALRLANGFDDSSAPADPNEDSEEGADSDSRIREEALDIAVSLVQSAPSLAQDPGVRSLVAEFEELLRGAPVSEDDVPDEALRDADLGDEGSPPSDADETAEEDSGASDGTLPETDQDPAPRMSIAQRGETSSSIQPGSLHIEGDSYAASRSMQRAVALSREQVKGGTFSR